MKMRQCLFASVNVWGVALTLCCIVGCGSKSGPIRYNYRGTVNYKGQAVKAGRILFEPDATRGNRGPQGYAVIQNGVYDTSKNGGKGAVGGPQIVRINGFDGKGATDDSPFGIPLFKPNEQRVELPKADSMMDFTVASSK
jgi:hypothetical protein